ncbi:MAG TPA: class I SAM-dependent methyltransferase [Thermomicrobiales bacterium]|nr:class I SAM-dependent methyltransferase [Thermomicrobiales bacterium]
MPRDETADRSWIAQVRSTWDKRAADWDLAAEGHALGADRTADIARVAVALDLHHGSALLDAGCGAGQYAISFAHLGCQVTGQDLSPAMIDRATIHARDRHVDIQFRVGDVADIPDPAGMYDAIHARVVLQFARDPIAVLREFRRVLKPGGRLFVSVPGSLSPIYARSWRRFTEPTVVGNTYLVPHELQALLGQNHFRIVEQWGDYGQNMSGQENELQRSIAMAPLSLQQAAATAWGFVVE